MGSNYKLTKIRIFQYSYNQKNLNSWQNNLQINHMRTEQVHSPEYNNEFIVGVNQLKQSQTQSILQKKIIIDIQKRKKISMPHIEHQKMIVQHLEKNSSLKYIFEHYCSKMQKNSIEYFERVNEENKMINLNKWMLFCKDFSLFKFYLQKSHLSQQTKHTNKQTQISKFLMKIFYVASNYKTKMIYSQFLIALAKFFSLLKTSKQFNDISDQVNTNANNSKNTIDLINKDEKGKSIQQVLFIDSVDRFKFITEKLNLLKLPKQINKCSRPLKTQSKKINKTLDVTARQNNDLSKKRNKSLSNSIKRPSLKVLFQQNPYQMNRIVKLANLQISKFQKYSQAYNNSYAFVNRNKENVCSKKHSLLTIKQIKSQKGETNENQFSHILSDRKYIQNILPLNKKIMFKEKQNKITQKNDQNSLQFSRLIKTIQLEKDQLLQSQLQMQKKCDKYMLQERVFMKLDQQISTVKNTCKKRLQLMILRQ